MTTISHTPPRASDADTDDEGLAVTGEVTVGFPASRSGYGQATYGNTQPERETATWLRVHADGTATAFAGKVEYGQGIRHGLTVEVADELCLPLERVTTILGDTAVVPWDMGTFGSQSTARVGLQLRRAAATAREHLKTLAADRLDLPASDLACADGRVVSTSDPTRAVDYGELVRGQQLAIPLDRETPLHERPDFTVMDAVTQRVDAEMRVTGRAIYSQDVQVPGMLFATVVRRPSYHATLGAVDATAAQAMPGVVQVVRERNLLAVLAESDEAGALAARVLRAEWEEQPGQPSRWDMPTLLVESAADGYATQEAGDLDAGFGAAEQVLESTYFIPYVTNAPMEPRAAVAAWDGDRLTVWAGTQRPFGVRSDLAQALDVEESKIHVIAPEIGGGFGGKSIYPIAVEAARLARAAGRPVRVAYTRPEETTWATFRPCALIQIKSGFRADGTLTAWEANAYHTGERVMIGRRGSETPYDVAHVRSMVYRSDSPLPSGSYRSLGAAVNHFAREVHMDEIAEAVGVDPLELRLRNLSHPRFRRVLERAASDIGWDADPAARRERGLGIGLGIDVGSYIATAVELRVQGKEVRVDRVAAALDCGLVVNPEGVRNQVEGSVVMGMGTALYEAIDFEAGRLLNPGFTRYRVPRINNAPRIDTALVGDDSDPSTGAGEPGIVPIAAAISNGVFAVTGQRHRELPIQRHM